MNNQLLFIPNRKTTFLLTTRRFGSFSVSVLSTEVGVDVTDDGGVVNVGYKMDINDAFASETTLSINIKEA